MNPYDTTTDGPRCAQCGGVLIGAERDWTTCGHCGGRSIPRAAWSYDFETASVRRRFWHSDRLTLTEVVVALFAGASAGIGFALGGLILWALGWAFNALAVWVGGWTVLFLASAAVGALGFLTWAAFNLDEVRK